METVDLVGNPDFSRELQLEGKKKKYNWLMW